MTNALENGLWKAADVIRIKGFAKGSLNKGGQFCAIGAYAEAQGESFGGDNEGARVWANSKHGDEMKVLADTIETLFGSRLPRGNRTDASYVMSFNDDSLTTEEDVVKVFRVAAVKAATGV